MDDRLAELSGASARLRTLEDQLSTLRADATEVAGDLEVETMEWHRERQDAETHLRAYRDRARELKGSLEGLQASGDDAPCPTCGRLLEEYYEKVLAVLRDEWDSVVQDGKWWRSRSEQLLLMPEALREVESRSIRMNAEVETLAEQVEMARSAVRELEDLKVLRAALIRRRNPGSNTSTGDTTSPS